VWGWGYSGLFLSPSRGFGYAFLAKGIRVIKFALKLNPSLPATSHSEPAYAAKTCHQTETPDQFQLVLKSARNKTEKKNPLQIMASLYMSIKGLFSLEKRAVWKYCTFSQILT
jgi:hypothetical protein